MICAVRWSALLLRERRTVYLVVDGVAERLHPAPTARSGARGVGIDVNGTKHLLGLLPCTKEDTASCRDFLRDLKARQLADPLMVIAYGTPDLAWAA